MIYVNGDSFTQGASLEDEAILDNFEAVTFNEWFEDNKRHNRAQLKYAEYINDVKRENRITHETSKSLMKERRWSTRLEQLTGINVYNISSLGGADIDSILYRSVSDIYDLKLANINITHVIIQLTGHMRYGGFCLDMDKLKSSNYNQVVEPEIYNYKVYTYNHSSDPLSDHVIIKPPHEWECATNTTRLYEMFLKLYQFESTLKNQFGITPIFVDSVFYKINLFGEDLIQRVDQVAEIIQAESKSELYLVDYMYDFCERLELSMIDNYTKNEKIFNPSMHVTSEVHVKFANSIANKYL